MEITPFEFHGKNIRTLTIDGEPWFVCQDVCRVLGLNTQNISQVVEKLYEDEKGQYYLLTPGGEQKIWFVNESGCYRLIMRSNKKDAIKFQRWLSVDVVPAIRKTGKYSVAPETPKSQIDLIIESAMVLKSLDDRISKIETIQNEANQNLRELPAPTHAIPERTVRSRINEWVNSYVKANGIPHSHCWNKLYQEYNYLFKTNLRRRANTIECSRLDIIELDNQLDAFYTICTKILPLED